MKEQNTLPNERYFSPNANVGYENTINIADFGAKGDGSDATNAIKNAILAIQNSRNVLIQNRLYCPAGTYLISDTINPTLDNFVFIGDGRGKTILKLADGTNKPIIQINGRTKPEIKDITFDGNKTNQSTSHSVIWLDSCIDIVLDIEVVNGYGYLDSSNGYGSVVLNNCSNALLQNPKVSNCKYNGLCFSGATGGNHNVYGGECDNNGYSGVSTVLSPFVKLFGTSAIGNGTSNITLNAPDNEAHGCRGLNSITAHGINIGHNVANSNADRTKVIGGNFSGNNQYGCSIYGDSTYPQNKVQVIGIHVNNNGVSGFKSLQTMNSTFSNIHADGNIQDGIYIDGNDNLCLNLHAYNNGRYGIYVNTASLRNKLKSLSAIGNTNLDIYDGSRRSIIDNNISIGRDLISTTDTNAKDLYTSTIGSNLLSGFGGLKLTVQGTKTGIGGNKTITIYFGGVTICQIPAANNTNAWEIEVYILNYTKTGQRFFAKIIDGSSTSIISGGASIDTSVDQTLKITAQAFTAGDSVTARNWLVDFVGVTSR